MAITAREQQMLDLAEQGRSDDEIAAVMNVKPSFVHQVLRNLSWSPAADIAREAAIRRGSEALGRAVLAAGGTADARRQLLPGLHRPCPQAAAPRYAPRSPCPAFARCHTRRRSRVSRPADRRCRRKDDTMTALRFFATGRPSLIGAPVKPMSKVDADFWRIRAERAARTDSGSVAPKSKAAARGASRAAASATTVTGNGDQP